MPVEHAFELAHQLDRVMWRVPAVVTEYAEQLRTQNLTSDSV